MSCKLNSSKGISPSLFTATSGDCACQSDLTCFCSTLDVRSVLSVSNCLCTPCRSVSFCTIDFQSRMSFMHNVPHGTVLNEHAFDDLGLWLQAENHGILQQLLDNSSPGLQCRSGTWSSMGPRSRCRQHCSSPLMSLMWKTLRSRELMWRRAGATQSINREGKCVLPTKWASAIRRTCFQNCSFVAFLRARHTPFSALFCRAIRAFIG